MWLKRCSVPHVAVREQSSELWLTLKAPVLAPELSRWDAPSNTGTWDRTKTDQYHQAILDPNVSELRALWSLLDGIWGLLKGSWGGVGNLRYMVLWLTGRWGDDSGGC